MRDEKDTKDGMIRFKRVDDKDMKGGMIYV